MSRCISYEKKTGDIPARYLSLLEFFLDTQKDVCFFLNDKNEPISGFTNSTTTKVHQPKRRIPQSQPLPSRNGAFLKSTLPETNSSHLKMVVSNRNLQTSRGRFSGASAVSFREGISFVSIFLCHFLMGDFGVGPPKKTWTKNGIVLVEMVGLFGKKQYTVYIIHTVCVYLNIHNIYI